MNNIFQIFAVYLAQLTFGSAILMPFFPNKITGKSYPRFYYGMIVLFFGLFLLALFRLDQFGWNHVLVFGLSVWIFGTTFRKDLSPIELYLYKLFAVVALVWFGLYIQTRLFPSVALSQSYPQVLLFMVSMIFLSFHLMNMIFGHWYLVNRKLPISYLIKTCYVLMIVTVVRCLATALSLYWASQEMSPDNFARITDFYAHGIFFWSRILAGLGVPLLVSVLAYKSAKIGSNQSATGIMYAGVVFVLMGEFLALYLYAITGYLF